MKRGVFIFWSIFVAAAVFRVWGSFTITPPDIGGCVKKTIQGRGTIAVEPERKETGQVFIVKTISFSADTDGGHGESQKDDTQKECGSGTLIRMKTKLYPQFAFGDEVTFGGKLSKPFNFSSDDGREFNYEGYLAKSDVFYEIKSATVEKVGEQQGFSIEALLYLLKRGFVANLERTLGDPYAALASGLVVGEKSALGPDLLNDFRTVGLIHIIVLSGYNITIVADALRKMLGFLPRVWGIVIGGIGIILFGVLVGGGATVVRSCFMAGVALTGEVIRRDYSVLRALIFAGLIMLIQNPLILLYDPSFQLSFLATLGLILLASPIEKKIQFIPEKFGMRGIVASTLATQVFVSPFILYMMGNLSIIGMVVNILVLPFIPITMLAVFLTGALGFIIPALSTVTGWATHLLLAYELFMVEHFARFPFASIQVPAFSGWIVTSFYGVLVIVYGIFVAKRNRSSHNIY
ncbi:MAG: ComEC/Rec2 family competence protein [Patescibacteria group bacterium]